MNKKHWNEQKSFDEQNKHQELLGSYSDVSWMVHIWMLVGPAAVAIWHISDSYWKLLISELRDEREFQ